MRAFGSVKYAGGGEGFQRPLWPIFIILITLATILENDERLKKKHLMCFISWLARFQMMLEPEIYIYGAPNNSNETYTFMCLGRGGRFGQC